MTTPHPTIAGSPAPGRRTQAERRAETRAKLLDATIASLLEVGYAGTTTRRVAELAGVSQGAMSHHFPHRVDLVGAAVERLTDRRLTELHELAAEFPSSEDERIACLLDIIWADFSSAMFTVFVKLWVAAADDADLYARLLPIERRLARALAEVSAPLAGELTARAEWERQMQLVMIAVRGLALTEQFEPHQRHRDPWPEVRETLLRTLRALHASPS